MQKNKLKKVEQKKLLPEWFIWAVTFTWGFYIFKNYYAQFMPKSDNLGMMLSIDQYAGILNIGNLILIKHILNIVLLSVFLFSAFGIGRVFLKLLKANFVHSLEESVFSIGIGFGIIAYSVFILGIFGLLYGMLIKVLILLFAVIGFIDLKKRPMKSLFGNEKLSLIDKCVLGILIFAMLISLAGALSPEIFYDSLVYHLGVPNYYKLNHKIVNMPYVFLSNLPAVASMLFTTGLLIKDEILSKLINYSASILCCLTLFSISKRYFNLKVGIWASLIFYTITHVMLSSWSCGTETILVLFAVLSLYALMNYNSEQNKWLIISSIFSGLAMGVKYTGIFVAVGVIFTFLIINRRFSADIIKKLIIFTFISTIIVSPWLIKNYVYKKNPVYPYLNSIFPKDAYSDYTKLNGFIVEARQSGKFELINWLKHPWNITMGKISNSENFTPLFLFLIPLLFLFGKPPLILIYGISYSIVIWLTWSFSTTMIRFMMPAFPILGLIISNYNNTGNHKSVKKVLSWVIIFTCVTGIYWAGWIAYIQGGWRVVFGKEKKSDFLSNTHSSYPYGYYAGIEFINKELPKSAKILFIGEGRSFYINRIPVVSSAHDLTPIIEYAKASKSGDELYNNIKSQGITHILFNLGEAIRLGKSYRMFQWDNQSLSVYNDFWEKYVKEIFHKDETQNGNFLNRVAVYEILSEQEASLPHKPPMTLMSEVVIKNIK